MKGKVLDEKGADLLGVTVIMVRDRAFGAGAATITTTGQEALRAIIAHERRVELAFENKRWLALVRTGKALEIMSAYGAALKANGKYPYLLPKSCNITADKLLSPNPFTEIQVNPKLKQNKGY